MEKAPELATLIIQELTVQGYVKGKRSWRRHILFNPFQGLFHTPEHFIA